MDSLVSQTVIPSKIIVVNDGSTDRTGEILSEFQEKYPRLIEVINTENKTRDYTRIPDLWNVCLSKEYDFQFIAAGDCVFEDKYCEKMLNKFRENRNLVIASGDFSPFKNQSPHGAGRFVRQDFFFKYYERYPKVIGYESEILIRVMMHDYEITIFNNIKMEHLDQLGHGHNFKEFGYAMRALGYHPIWALFRCINDFVRNNQISKRGALNMFWYYLTYRPQIIDSYYSEFPADIQNWIYHYQRQMIVNLLLKPLKICTDKCSHLVIRNYYKSKYLIRRLKVFCYKKAVPYLKAKN